MRDLLPAEAEAQGRLASCALRAFELHGFQQVSVPAFEYADVLERGLGMIEPHSILRFVEPETGEVVALRPDMTPQVARLVSTRLTECPGPVRLSYRGSVLRRQHERARHDQQMLQAGIELVGVSGVEADLEVIGVCTKAVREAGLNEYVLDLGHGGIASALLSETPDPLRADLIECLSLKDGFELKRRAEKGALDESLKEALVSLVGLQGGAEVFSKARASLEKTAAWKHVEQLQELYEAILAAGLADTVVVDLGETRAAAYYTGPTFQILAEGPGQAVASGGRYDDLYGLFGAPRPALGGAIQLDHLRWALGESSESGPIRVLVTADGSNEAAKTSANEALSLLRDAGIVCVLGAKSGALDYARAWRYSHVAFGAADGSGFSLVRIDGENETDLGSTTPDQLVTKLRP